MSTQWTKSLSKSTGKHYYFNAATKQSLWHDDSLPEGWAFGRESEGKSKFYVHLSTGFRSESVPTAATVIPTSVATATAHTTVPSTASAAATSHSTTTASTAASISDPAQLSLIASKTAGDDLLSTAYIPDATTRGANIPEQVAGKRDYFFKGVPADLRWQLQVDDVALYSITEWNLAAEQTRVIESFCTSSAVITDATACVGGNTISFAQTFRHVNSIELSAQRAKMLQHNVELLKLADKVSIYNDDYTHAMRKLGQDVVFFDPPWGGKDYKSADKLDMYLGDYDVADLITLLLSANPRTHKPYAKFVALKAPVNYNTDGLNAKIASSGCNATTIHSDVMPRHKPKMLFLILKASDAPPVAASTHPLNVTQATTSAVAGTKRKEPSSSREAHEGERRAPAATAALALEVSTPHYPAKTSYAYLTITDAAGWSCVDAPVFHRVVQAAGETHATLFADSATAAVRIKWSTKVVQGRVLHVCHPGGDTSRALRYDGARVHIVDTPSDEMCDNSFNVRPFLQHGIKELLLSSALSPGANLSPEQRDLLSTLALPHILEATIAGTGKRGCAYRARMSTPLLGDKTVDRCVVKCQAWDERVELELCLAQRLQITAASPLAVPFMWCRDTTDCISFMEDAGTPLLARVKARGPCNAAVTARLLRRLCLGLHTIHTADMLYCDLHPDNVLLHDDDSTGDTARLIDFGSLQQMSDSGVYRGPTRGGRWDFMPLEQFGPGKYAAGEVTLTPASDVYAACACAVFMLTGEAPFAPVGKLTVDGAMKHPRRDVSALDAAVRRVQPSDALLEVLLSVILQGLAVRPEARISLTAMLARLEALAS